MSVGAHRRSSPRFPHCEADIASIVSRYWLADITYGTGSQLSYSSLAASLINKCHFDLLDLGRVSAVGSGRELNRSGLTAICALAALIAPYVRQPSLASGDCGRCRCRHVRAGRGLRPGCGLRCGLRCDGRPAAGNSNSNGSSHSNDGADFPHGAPPDGGWHYTTSTISLATNATSLVKIGLVIRPAGRVRWEVEYAA